MLSQFEMGKIISASLNHNALPAIQIPNTFQDLSQTTPKRKHKEPNLSFGSINFINLKLNTRGNEMHLALWPRHFLNIHSIF